MIIKNQPVYETVIGRCTCQPLSGTDRVSGVGHVSGDLSQTDRT